MQRSDLPFGSEFSPREVDQIRINELLGVNVKEFKRLAKFTPEQHAYLKALAKIDHGGPHPSNDIEKLAAAVYGVAFNRKNLLKQVLHPLQDAGYIDLEKDTTEAGRATTSFLVTATAKLTTEVVVPLLAQVERQTQRDVWPFLSKPLKEIRRKLKSRYRRIRGLALEALAFKLMQLIDLPYVVTQLHGSTTGGTEVRLIFERTWPMFSRWQVQCTNAARVSLDEVAKEVGFADYFKSHTIVMVSTGEISSEARRYADKIMTDSNLCIVMMNGNDLTLIEAQPGAIVDVFTRETCHAINRTNTRHLL